MEFEYDVCILHKTKIIPNFKEKRSQYEKVHFLYFRITEYEQTLKIMKFQVSKKISFQASFIAYI